MGLTQLQDVHETAVGALWNLAFNPGNALRMAEEGVPALVHLCSSSRSKMARFMAALALAYMFDGRYSTHICLYELDVAELGGIVWNGWVEVRGKRLDVVRVCAVWWSSVVECFRLGNN